jgi:hypothetical protein
VGILAILALIGNGFFFNYSLDIRPYPMVMLVSAVATWMLQRWLDQPTMGRALGYGLSIALMLYTHYLLALLVTAHVIYVVLSRRLSIQVIHQGLLAGMVGAILFAPWFPVFVNQVIGLRNVETQSGDARGVLGIGVSTFTTSPESILSLLNTATNGLIPVYAIMLVVGVFLLWRERAFWLATIWGVLAPALYLAANLIFALYAPRFVSYMTLGIALAIGATLVTVVKRLKLPTVTAFVPLVGLVMLHLLTFSAQIPNRIPYRDIFGEINERAGADDLVLLLSANEENGFVQYQYRTWLASGLRENMTTELDTAHEARRVWLITGTLFSPEYETFFAEFEPTHPVQYVTGECQTWCYIVQLMEAPPLDSPQIFGGVLPFYGIDIDSVSEESIQARLWWRVDSEDQRPKLDYSVGLHLLSPSGELVAQNDGAINHYGREVVHTSAMDTHKIYIDYRSLQLPRDLRDGEFTLAVIVYQSWNGVRLTLPDGADRLIAQRISVPIR